MSEAQSPNQVRAGLIELMAPAFWEAEKPQGSTLPDWSRIEPTYQAAVRRGLAGALAAAEQAGWKIVSPEPSA
jgi:hypothetical protein